jgi:hypothetical protein
MTSTLNFPRPPIATLTPIVNGVIDETNKIIFSDHNRKDFQTTYEHIEKSTRMANGTTRKYVVAIKRSFPFSWDNLYSNDYNTVDGYAGAESLRRFYETYCGTPLQIKIYASDYATILSNVNIVKSTPQKLSTNLIYNSSFEVSSSFSSTTWTASNASTASISPGADGSGSAIQLTASANYPVIQKNISAFPSQSYTLSAYMNNSSSAGTRAHIIGISWYDSTGTIIGTEVTTASTLTAGAGWTRMVLSATSPSNTMAAKLAFYGGSSTFAASWVSRIDNIQLEYGPNATTYYKRFDEILTPSETTTVFINGFSSTMTKRLADEGLHNVNFNLSEA